MTDFIILLPRNMSKKSQTNQNKETGKLARQCPACLPVFSFEYECVLFLSIRYILNFEALFVILYRVPDRRTEGRPAIFESEA